MASSIHFTRDLAGNLRPSDAESRAAILETKVGAVYRADVVLPRNYKRLKWWWKLCAVVSENSEHYPSSKSVRDMLKLKCGHFETIVVPGKTPGEWVTQYIPGSIAVSSMKEPEFKALCQAAVRMSAEVLACTSEQLESALNDFLGIDLWPEGRAA